MNATRAGRRTRAAVYARTNMPDATPSIQNQCESLREYAAKHDIEVVRVYADVNKSGSDPDGLDNQKRLLADATSPDRDFSVILMYDWTRWGRFLDAREAYHQYLCSLVGVEFRVCNSSSPSHESSVDDIVQCAKRSLAKACGTMRFSNKRDKRRIRYVPRQNPIRRRKLWK